MTPRGPRRSTSPPRRSTSRPPGGPGGQQIAPGKSTTRPRKPRRSTSHAPEVYKSPPGGPGGQQIAPGRSTTRPRKPRRSTSHAPEVYTSPPEGPGGPQVTPKRRLHPPSPSLPAPCLEPPASEWPWRNSRSVNNFSCAPSQFYASGRNEPQGSVCLSPSDAATQGLKPRGS